MSIITQLLPENSSPRDRFALRAALALQAATLVFAITYVFLYLIIAPNWQLLAVAGISAGYGIYAMLLTPLIKRGYTNLAAWLMIAGICLIFPAAALLIQGLSILLGLSLVLLVVFFASQALAGPQMWLAIGVSLVFGAITMGLDRVPVENRLSLPQLQFFITGVTVTVLAVFSVFVFRRFADYSLRVKLIVGFLVVSLVSVAVVSAATAITVYPQYEQEIAADLRGVAEAQSTAMANLLGRQVEALNQLANSSPVVIETKFANQSYTENQRVEPNRDQILAQILALDEYWQTAADTDILLQSRLMGGRVFELTQFQNFFPDHSQLFFTDIYGAMAVATGRTPHLYYGNEPWWQAAYNNGQGGVYIGPPTYNADTGTFGIRMAVPIRALETDDVVGVMHSFYSIEPLLGLLDIPLGQDSGLDLYLPDGRLLEAGALDNTPQDSSELLTPLETPADLGANVADQPGIELDYKGIPSIVTQSAVESGRNSFVDALGWRVVAYESDETAQLAVSQQTNVSLRLGLITALIAALGGAVVSQWLTGPIVRLTNVVQSVTTGGNLTRQVPVESRDEIGVLAESFNTMTEHLQKSFVTLEEQVQERTRQLELVVDISRKLSAILDLNELMRNVVAVTKETFNFYHVHIYLLDAAKETLVMAEGYGQAGEEMKRQQHSIAYSAPRSLVARAAREERVITVENVRDDPSWLPNPLLPETHSEMAVPVMLDTEVVGVLDIQSERVGGLSQRDEATMLGLAQQIAVAVRNARQFADTQAALSQARRLQSVYTGEAWSKFGATRPTHFEVRPAEETPALAGIITPEAVAALEQRHTVGLRLGNGVAPPPAHNGDALAEGAANALATPLMLRDRVIGVLGIRDETNPGRRWSEDEIALIEAVSEQMSLAIENARLFEETGRRAGRERMIAEVTQQVWASGQLEKVLETAVKELGSKLNASKVVVRLGSPEEILPK